MALTEKQQEMILYQYKAELAMATELVRSTVFVCLRDCFAYAANLTTATYYIINGSLLSLHSGRRKKTWNRSAMC